MTTLSRTAGAAGSITLTTKNSAGQLITPVSDPVAKWYTDSGRTAGEVTLTVAGSGSAWTASWTAGQAPATVATRYLKFTIEVSAGVSDVDADDEISFVDAVVGVDDLAVSLTEVKELLERASGDTGDDTEITRYIQAATEVIEEHIGGKIVPTIVTETLTPLGGRVFLGNDHVVSITTVTEYSSGTATVLTAEDHDTAGTYLWDGVGILRRSSFSDTSWVSGTRNVVVTYVAGFSPIPQAIKDAVKALVLHWWLLEKQSGRPAFGDEGGTGLPGADFSGLPNLVANKLRPWRRAPRVA